MSTRAPHGSGGRGPSVRTPSAAVLVQALFLFGAIGTGVASALVTWLAPRREAAPSKDTTDPEKEGEARDE